MGIVKISPSGQVRIPKDAMKAMNAEAGDYLDFSVRHGEVVVMAKRLVDAGQAWFWSPEWQKQEREADEDKKAGRVSKTFDTAKEGIAYLRKKRAELRRKQPA